MTDDEVIEALVSCGYERDDVQFAQSGPETTDVLVVPLKNRSDWHAEWTTLRKLVDRTGRWPIATITPFDRKGRDRLRVEFGNRNSSAADSLAKAAATDHNPDEVFENYVPWELNGDVPPVQYLSGKLNYGAAVKERWLAEALTDLGPSPTLREAERWLVAKQIAEERNIWDADIYNSSWANDHGQELECVVLVPDPDPINGLAYVPTMDSNAESNLTACRRWEKEHHVELVAAGHNYLFQMPKPVSDPDQAWRLAIEIFDQWQHSLGGGAKAAESPLSIAPILSKLTRFDGTVFP